MVDFDFSELEPNQRSTFHHAVHHRNYKDGAFKSEITASTDVLDTINIFLASPLTTEWEKDKFRAAGQAIFDVRHHNAGDTQNGRLIVLAVLMELITVFERDQIKRGIDVPPMIAQIFDREGNLKETTTCDTYGNVTAIPGGPDLLGAFKAHATAEDKKSRAKAETAKAGATELGEERMPTTTVGKACHSLMLRQERTSLIPPQIQIPTLLPPRLLPLMS